MATYVRLPFIKLLIGLYLLFLASASHAALVFTGSMIDVSYQGSDFTVGTDSFIAGDTSPDIAYQDGSNIGDDIMIDFESITFNDSSVVFQIRGDGPAHSAGYQKTGLLGSYTISLASPGIIFESVLVDTSANMIGLGLNSGITFDTKNIYFDLSSFGILDQSNEDIGTVTLDVGLVPVPAALPLMLSGLAALLLLNRRRRTV